MTEPTKDLRRRAPGSVEKDPGRWWSSTLVPWAITAAMSIALIAIGLSGRRQIGDTARLRRALSILDDPAARAATFGETDKAAARGRVFVSPGEGMVFIGASLPRIDPGRTFELWMIPAAGNAMPGGLFQSQSDATAVFVRTGPVENAAAIEVTVEPEGGSAQPTTTPFIVTKLR